MDKIKLLSRCVALTLVAGLLADPVMPAEFMADRIRPLTTRPTLRFNTEAVAAPFLEVTQPYTPRQAAGLRRTLSMAQLQSLRHAFAEGGDNRFGEMLAMALQACIARKASEAEIREGTPVLGQNSPNIQLDLRINPLYQPLSERLKTRTARELLEDLLTPAMDEMDNFAAPTLRVMTLQKGADIFGVSYPGQRVSKLRAVALAERTARFKGSFRQASPAPGWNQLIVSFPRTAPPAPTIEVNSIAERQKALGLFLDGIDAAVQARQNVKNPNSFLLGRRLGLQPGALEVRSSIGIMQMYAEEYHSPLVRNWQHGLELQKQRQSGRAVQPVPVPNVSLPAISEAGTPMIGPLMPELDWPEPKRRADPNNSVSGVELNAPPGRPASFDAFMARALLSGSGAGPNMPPGLAVDLKTLSTSLPQAASPPADKTPKITPPAPAPAEGVNQDMPNQRPRAASREHATRLQAALRRRIQNTSDRFGLANIKGHLLAGHNEATQIRIAGALKALQDGRWVAETRIVNSIALGLDDYIVRMTPFESHEGAAADRVQSSPATSADLAPAREFDRQSQQELREKIWAAIRRTDRRTVETAVRQAIGLNIDEVGRFVQSVLTGMWIDNAFFPKIEACIEDFADLVRGAQTPAMTHPVQDPVAQPIGELLEKEESVELLEGADKFLADARQLSNRLGIGPLAMAVAERLNIPNGNRNLLANLERQIEFFMAGKKSKLDGDGSPEWDALWNVVQEAADTHIPAQASFSRAA